MSRIAFITFELYHNIIVSYWETAILTINVLLMIVITYNIYVLIRLFIICYCYTINIIIKWKTFLSIYIIFISYKYIYIHTYIHTYQSNDWICAFKYYSNAILKALPRWPLYTSFKFLFVQALNSNISSSSSYMDLGRYVSRRHPPSPSSVHMIALPYCLSRLTIFNIRYGFSIVRSPTDTNWVFVCVVNVSFKALIL